MITEEPELALWRRPEGVDWQRFAVDDSTWRSVVLAFDQTHWRDWPRQRSHFVFSHELDGWQIVVELHSFDGYDPALDVLNSADIVDVSIEPAGNLTLEHRRAERQKGNHHASLETTPTYNEDGEVDGPQLWHDAVGERPHGRPSVSLLKKLTASRLDASVRLLLRASALVPESDRLRGWYRLPTPRTTPTKRGKGGRNIREWAELASLYMYAYEVSPEAPVKWLSQEFSYTGYPSSWWHGIAGDLTKRGFLEGRNPGHAGGVLGERTIRELEAHRR